MIKVVRVRDAWKPFSEVIWHCCFCGAKTETIHYPTWTAVCRECAEKKEPEDMEED